MTDNDIKKLAVIMCRMDGNDPDQPLPFRTDGVAIGQRAYPAPPAWEHYRSKARDALLIREALAKFDNTLTSVAGGWE